MLFFYLYFIPKVGYLCDHISRNILMKRIYIFSFFVSIIFTIILGYLIKSGILFILIIAILSIYFNLLRTSDQIVRTAYISSNYKKDESLKMSKYLELVRQSITLLVGIIGYFVLLKNNFNSIMITTTILIGLAYCLTLKLTDDVPANLKYNINNDDKSKFEKKKSSLKENYNITKTIDPNVRFFLYISSVSYICIMCFNFLTVSLFKELNYDSKHFIFSSVPYGLGATLSAFSIKKEISNPLKNVNIYLIVFIISLVNILIFRDYLFSIYISLFGLSFSHSSIRIIRTHYFLNSVDNSIHGRVSSFFESMYQIIIAFLLVSLGILCDFSDVFTCIKIILAIIVITFLILNEKNKIFTTYLFYNFRPKNRN